MSDRTSKHTPTPWEYRPDDELVGWANPSTGLFHIVADVYDDNGEFIVRACNAHDDLLGALRGILAEVDDYPERFRFAFFSDALDVARDAVARAEGASEGGQS